MKYLNLATLLLAILKLTGLLHIGWLIVFVPTFIYFGAIFITLALVALVFTTVSKEVWEQLKDDFDKD